jgi:hypothetical protein
MSYSIIRCFEIRHHKETKKLEHIYNEASDELAKYIEKHGLHFTEELAAHASKMMENADKKEHSWTPLQVESSLTACGITFDKSHLGDLTYAANMAYADYYPEPLKDEAACIKYAHKTVKDPDGYDGKLFCHWVTDLMAKGVHIQWDKFT